LARHVGVHRSFGDDEGFSESFDSGRHAGEVDAAFGGSPESNFNHLVVVRFKSYRELACISERLREGLPHLGDVHVGSIKE
jgi:hypothetical protein